MDVTWDQAFMYPMLEMAGNRFQYIKQILYIYNVESPINDFKIKLEKQKNMEKYIRGLPKYEKIDNF